MEIIVEIIIESWLILLESSVFILFGFFVAGLLKAFLPDDFITRHLGKREFSGVLKASAMGLPIPL